MSQSQVTQLDNGGKANALKRMQVSGFAVPPFFLCDSTWTRQKVLEQITDSLGQATLFAVRSSATLEDTSTNSAAGRYYSAVGVPKRRVYTEIAKVQASYGNSIGKVIVQEFIPSDRAGVLFTQVDTDYTVINATIGLCLPVVGGQPCDEYVLHRDGQILRRTIPKQKPIQVVRGLKILHQKINQESLNLELIHHLTRLGRDLERLFGTPQDVEWCVCAGQLYVLQSRPITRDFLVHTKEYFDSANIAESYAGVVLPLTCSFAQSVYKQAYTDFLAMSGVSRRTLKQHSSIFANLLGFFYGRVYYNMNNWYKMAALVPGYQQNKENFEQMITSNLKADIPSSLRPSLHLRILYPFILLAKISVFGITSNWFRATVGRLIRQFHQLDLSTFDYQDCLSLYGRFESQILRRWYVTLENDFLVMTYLGLLRKLVDEQTLQALIRFPSKATEQVDALATLSRQTQTIQPLWSAIQADDLNQFQEVLSQHSSFSEAVKTYLQHFGGRFASELKLESVGIDEDPSKLMSLLRAYSSYQRPRLHPPSRLNLPPLKRLLVQFVLSRFTRYATQREEFRLLRSNAFALTRKLVRRMGTLLVKQGQLDTSDDVFYLTVQEICSGTALTNRTLGQLVLKRKRQYKAYDMVHPPTHFVTTNSAPPQLLSADHGRQTLQGRPACPGIVRGTVKIFRQFTLPPTIDFDILVTAHTDPGWTSLIALSKGLIIEHGGVLSHASIVARELGIPTVIGVQNAVSLLKDGQTVEINGSTGSITVI